MPAAAAVFRAHQRHSRDNAKIVPDIFGDGYLYDRNLIYRNLRNSVIQLGYKLQGTDVDWYRLYPMNALDEIFRRKVLPYWPNRAAYQRACFQVPSRYPFKMIPAPSSNYLLHESAHCLFNSIFENEFKKSSSARKTQRVNIIGTLMGESFAEACELTGWFYCANQVDAEIYKANIYHVINNEDKPYITRTCNSIGIESTLKFVFFCYLYLNFLYREVGPEESQSIIDLVFGSSGISPSRTRLLKTFASKIELSLTFRLLTTRFFLKSHGIGMSLERALFFDFMNEIRADARFSKVVALAVQTVLRPRKVSLLNLSPTHLPKAPLGYPSAA